MRACGWFPKKKSILLYFIPRLKLYNMVYAVYAVYACILYYYSCTHRLFRNTINQSWNHVGRQPIAVKKPPPKTYRTDQIAAHIIIIITDFACSRYVTSWIKIYYTIDKYKAWAGPTRFSVNSLN